MTDIDELRKKLFDPPNPTHHRFLNMDAKKSIILALVQDGMSIGRAANKAGLSRSDLRELLSKEPDFATLLDDSYNLGTDYLEDLALERAHESDSVLIKLLESRRPEKFSSKRQVGAAVKVEIRNISGVNSTTVSVESPSLSDERLEGIREGGQTLLPSVASKSG